MVGGRGRGEVPFHEGGSGDKGDVVEIDYLKGGGVGYLF